MHQLGLAMAVICSDLKGTLGVTPVMQKYPTI